MLLPFTNLVTRFTEARALHAEAVQLRQELASYRTPAERAELQAVFSRHTEEDLDLLARKAGDRLWAA